jgi:hypothetical protein
MQEQSSTHRLSKATQFLAAAAVILIAGCADMQTPGKTAILGIGDVAAKQEVDVVLIHGMGSSSGIGWAVDANAKLAAAIERSFDEQAFRNQKPAHPNADKIELYSGELTRAGSPPVHTHSIVWSTVVTPWKQTLCYDTSEKIDGVCDSPPVHGRALANSWLKTDLLDARLSDVVFYVSEDQAIVPGVVASLRKVLSGEAPTSVRAGSAEQMAARKVPVFFMSESLGSKILLDSLLVLFEHPPLPHAIISTATARTASRFGAFFMAANQVAMLSPRVIDSTADETCADMGGPPNRVRADCRLVQFSSMLGQRAEARFPVPIVAFSDRNDLLSWRLEPYFSQLCHAGSPFCDVNVIDVEVSNAPAWFGLLEDPSKAHTAYWGQGKVQKILNHGMTASPQPTQ